MNASLLEYPAWLISIFILLAILLFIWLGVSFKKYEIKRGKEISVGPPSPVETSMLNLMALMLAFTFGMALTKFEARRRAIVDETNAIESAILRCKLFPDSIQPVLRSDLARYIDARIAFNDAGADYIKIRRALDQTMQGYSTIWDRLAGFSRSPATQYPTTQMLPAMSSVISIATTREAERLAKVPPLILIVLLVLVLTSSFVIGYNPTGAKRSKIFVWGFALMTAITIYLILELERPWSGLLNVRSTEQRIVTLKKQL
jgi:hypothetical protein